MTLGQVQKDDRLQALHNTRTGRLFVLGNGASLRHNILDIVFAAPAPGVKLTKKELAIVEKYGTLKRRHDV